MEALDQTSSKFLGFEPGNNKFILNYSIQNFRFDKANSKFNFFLIRHIINP